MTSDRQIKAQSQTTKKPHNIAGEPDGKKLGGFR